MGRHLLEVLVPAVISALLLWEGVQGKHSRYSLKASSPVSVQLGLRVNIPCTFTYDPAHDDPRAKLYGYWYVEDHPRRPSLVATNNPERMNDIEPHIRRRFEVSGPNLTRGDCSLTIKDVEMADHAIYHFRMEKGRRARYSYSAAEEKVSVIVTGINPRLSISELLRAGNKTSITCVAPRSSSSDPPTITWSGFHEDSRLEITPRTSRNTVESIVDFTLVAADHLRNVTCKATYVRGSRRVTGEMTVTLSVNYSPRKFRFSGHLTHPNGEIQNFTNISQISPREGDSLVVHCEADGNPQSSVSWRRRVPATRRVIFDNELRFPNLKLEDQGKYICDASNPEGDAEDSFNLQIGSINPFLSISGSLREGNTISITCVAPRSSSSNPPTITWSGFHEDSRLEITPRMSRNTVESIVDFTLVAADHLRNITCKATYVRGSRRVTGEMTVTLSVNYSPRKFQFSGHLTRPNGEVQNFTNISQITPRKGDSLVVYCEPESNPQGSAVWRLRFPANRLVIFNNELTLSNIESEDQGKYICDAINTEGHAMDSFNLQIRTWEEEEDYIPMMGP